MLLLLLAPALAAELTCAELQRMAQTRIPEAQIVDTIAALGLSEDEVACVEASGLSPAVKEAAQQNRLATSVLAPPPPPAPPVVDLAPPVGRPALDPALERWLRESDCSPLYLAEVMPERGAAMAWSLVVGFGAGHFYARRPRAGLAFLALEGANAVFYGVGVAGLGENPAAPDSSRRAPWRSPSRDWPTSAS